MPIIIGESNPEGCAACGMHTNPKNAYRNGTMFSSYTAAAFARKYALADHFKVNLIGVVSWAFKFEDQPWFHGFRDLATNDVDKPVLNVFRMYGKMTGKRLEGKGNQPSTFLQVKDSSVRRKSDIDALATTDKNTAAVMVWHYHDDDTIAPAAPVEIRVKGILSKKVGVKHYRIDSVHSNSYEAWKKMGSPQQPTAAQIKTLGKAGKLQELAKSKKIQTLKGEVIIQFMLPRQVVSLVQLFW